MKKLLAVAALTLSAVPFTTPAHAVGCLYCQPNGIELNGILPNGLEVNGLEVNGGSLNGISQNGISQNGGSSNGTTSNGFRQEPQRSTIFAVTLPR